MATPQSNLNRSKVAPLGWPEWAGLGLIALATCLAYGPALGGGMLWDDAGYQTRSDLRPVSGLLQIWLDVKSAPQYFPLLHSLFWLEYRLWRDHMLGYHGVNLLLHLLAVSLVYANVRKLQIPGALLAAAIFALHPVHVGTVAWISEQKNTLSAVFYLGAMLAYLNFDERRLKSQYVWALLLFVLAALSKSVAATLPAALLVIFWWKRGTLSWRRDVLPLVPFFALAIADALLTAWLERTSIGAQGRWFELSFLDRCLVAGNAIWFYLWKLVWPLNLAIIYPRWELNLGDWRQWICPALTVVVSAGLWAARRYSRAPLAGWLFFVGTMSPVLGFLNVYYFRFSFVSDHYQYLPSLGIIVPVAGLIASRLQNVSLQLRYVGSAACAVLLGVLGMLSWNQSHYYGDAFTLYNFILQRNPECWLAQNNLGIELLNDDRPDEALPHLKKAIEIDPESAESYCNLGQLLCKTGHMDEGIDQYRTAIRLKPDHARTYNNLGDALLKLGRTQEAVDNFQQAILVRPSYAEAYNNLAAVMLNTGQPREAIRFLEQSLAIDPDIAEAHRSLGMALASLGDSDKAIRHFRETVRLKPDYFKGWTNLALESAKAGNGPEAVAAGEKALRLAREQGQTEAADQLEQWLQAQPPPRLELRSEPQ